MNNGWNKNKADYMKEGPVNIIRGLEALKINLVYVKMDSWVIERPVLRGLSFHLFNSDKIMIYQTLLIVKNQVS